MTVSTVGRRQAHNGNGVTVAFALPYLVLDQADVDVYVGGVLQTITTHYTVSGVGDVGGVTVTFVTAPATGTANVVLVRTTAQLQDTDLAENDDMPSELIETTFDKLMLIIQETVDDAARAIHVSDSYGVAFDGSFTPVASKLLQINAALTGFDLIDPLAAWIVAAGAPAGGTGNNGDMYINSTTGDVYGPKASGAWGSIAANIKGDTGATGAAGTNGSDGADGIFTGAEAQVTAASTDLVPIQDVSDSNNPKRVTVQSIADLAGGGEQDAGGNVIGYANKQITAGDYTTAADENLLIVGDFEIDTGDTVTITSGSRVVIV